MTLSGTSAINHRSPRPDHAMVIEQPKFDWVAPLSLSSQKHKWTSPSAALKGVVRNVGHLCIQILLPRYNLWRAQKGLCAMIARLPSLFSLPGMSCRIRSRKSDTSPDRPHLRLTSFWYSVFLAFCNTIYVLMLNFLLPFSQSHQLIMFPRLRLSGRETEPV